MKQILRGCFLLMVLTKFALGHCDGLDGPVVQAAREALENKNVNLVLIWVKREDEAEIKTLFKKTLAMRETGNDTLQADRHFFETVVRVHRAGEGAGFTGLKPAGRDLGPAIPVADQAVRSGDVDPLLQLLDRTVQQRIRDSFAVVQQKKGFPTDDVERGRQFVEAYVSYIHLVERIYQQATTGVHGHFHENSVNTEGDSTHRATQHHEPGDE
jgi:hypothetical protein